MTNQSGQDGHNEELCSSTQSPGSVPEQSSGSTLKQISRRQFGRNAAAAMAAATALTAPALLATNAAAQAKTPAQTAPQQKNPEPLEGLTPEQTAEVDARHANILRKYGSRFTDDQKARLRRILAQNERMMAPVRAFPLENGDPPASVLRLTFDELKAAPKKEGR
jgi:hypothetical protein